MARSAGRAGFTQAIINDRDTLTRPTERERTIHQMILKLGTILVITNFIRG
jgi:hypothetical protein